jgi:molybdopterin molybdotransferase
MIAFEVFARPAILKLAGQTSWQKTGLTARLAEPVSNSGRRHYMRAFVYPDEQGYRVTTRDSSVQVQGSGILTSMVWANCLVIVPEGESHLAEGTLVNIWLLD